MKLDKLKPGTLFKAEVGSQKMDYWLVCHLPPEKHRTKMLALVSLSKSSLMYFSPETNLRDFKELSDGIVVTDGGYEIL